MAGPRITTDIRDNHIDRMNQLSSELSTAADSFGVAVCQGGKELSGFWKLRCQAIRKEIEDAKKIYGQQRL